MWIYLILGSPTICQPDLVHSISRPFWRVKSLWPGCVLTQAVESKVGDWLIITNLNDKYTQKDKDTKISSVNVYRLQCPLAHIQKTKTKTKNQHMPYFWKAGGSRISNMIIWRDQTRPDQIVQFTLADLSRICVIVLIGELPLESMFRMQSLAKIEIFGCYFKCILIFLNLCLLTPHTWSEELSKPGARSWSSLTPCPPPHP